jgi:hypothetical protein
MRSGASRADATSRATTILVARNVQDFAVAFPENDPEAADRGDEIVVEVAAPTVSNSPLAGQFITNRLLTSRVVMVKE